MTEQSNINYGPDSIRQNSVPRGTVTEHRHTSSYLVLGETTRSYWVYIPAQYEPNTPIGLMVFQDGHAYVDISEDSWFRVPIVFDNLIHKKKIPPLIGLFVNPGHNDGLPDNPWRASNRSFEYDTLDDEYVQFLIDELIPVACDGLNLSDDPKMRAICGASSGGICAFTAAWQKPTHFHKVMSHIGSFTDINGGHKYPTLIRKSSKRDIKVFLQDGSNDLNVKFGNWWLSNLQMQSALEFRGYEHKFVGGTGGHDFVHGGAIFPESLTWLWQPDSESI